MSTRRGEKLIRGGIWRKLGIVTVTTAFACSVVLGGCEKTEEAIETSGTDGGSRLQVGPSFDSFVIERWIRERDVFVPTTKTLGADVSVQNANGNVREQIEQTECPIRRQMDMIAVVVGGCGALSDVMKKAKDAGTRIVSYDRLITNADCDLYVSFDNEEVERLMVRCFLEHVSEGGDIFMIRGSGASGNVLQIQKGFNEVLAGSGLNMVYKANCGGWLVEYAFTYVKEELAQHRGVKGIMCGNDDPVTRAFRVLSEERLAGKVVLTGQDGDPMICRRIMEGVQNMAAFKFAEEEARSATEYAVKLGGGEKLTDITKAIDDGTYKVPYGELVPVAVTRDSMDEMIIKGGFHAEEDMYLNVGKQGGTAGHSGECATGGLLSIG